MSPQNRRKLSFGFACALASSALGSIAYHNGRVDSVPPGTGAVNVGLVYDSLGQYFFQFNENAQHELGYSYLHPFEPPYGFVEYVQNSTSQSWSGFNIGLTGADFFGAPFGGLSPLVNPVEELPFGFPPDNDEFIDIYDFVGNMSVASSEIIRQGNDAVLSIHFGDLVSPGEAFLLAYSIHDVAGIHDGFIIDQRPQRVPGPGAATLLGLAAVAAPRRSRRSR
jgi:hypothetical protein